MLVAHAAGQVFGHVQLIDAEDAGTLEIKSLAVRQDCQSQGLGTRLVEAAILRSRAQQGRRVIVGTAAADIGNLRFYQKCGFRMFRIERDVFVAENGYPDDCLVEGIVLRDQVYLDFDLTG